jgi:pyruvate kinase
LALVWGVHSVLCHEVMDVVEMTDIANQAVRREGFGEAGQSIVISAGLPFNEPGTPNLLRISQLP